MGLDSRSSTYLLALLVLGPGGRTLLPLGLRRVDALLVSVVLPGVRALAASALLSRAGCSSAETGKSMAADSSSSSSSSLLTAMRSGCVGEEVVEAELMLGGSSCAEEEEV